MLYILFWKEVFLIFIGAFAPISKKYFLVDKVKSVHRQRKQYLLSWGRKNRPNDKYDSMDEALSNYRVDYLLSFIVLIICMCVYLGTCLYIGHRLVVG